MDGTAGGTRLGLWEIWLGLAERHAEFAAQCRSSDDELDALAESLRNSATETPSEKRVANGNELEHTMLAVSASAHALDGLYGTVKRIVRPPKSNAARHRQILETLKLGFNVGHRAGSWLNDLDWLFERRDSIVHHADDYRPMGVTRQTQRTVVFGGPELRDLGAAAAARAAKLAREVVDTCIANPKSITNNWVAGWANYEAGPGETIFPSDVQRRTFPFLVPEGQEGCLPTGPYS